MTVAPATFAGLALDRAGLRRTDAAWLAERLADPDSRAVVANVEGVAVDEDRLARLPLGDLPGEPVLLGVEDGRALFAVDADAPGVVNLRAAGVRLTQEEGALAAYAAAMTTWHRRHPRCAVCGAATEMGEAGHVRRCPSCEAVHHPRTDPVVIMLVVDGDRALLGRQPTWPEGRWSALAGFVEPGETLETAVAREVLEESGVTVGDVRYVASQPWPFPASLMVGFEADHATGEPEVRDPELEAVRWFSREELCEARRDGLILPPKIAIARRLIDRWLG